MALQRHPRILAVHPGAVVAHANERLAPVFQLHAHRMGAGIEGVLDELLDDRRGPLDHFARGDLVGDISREHLDARAREHTHSPEISSSSTQPWIPSFRLTSRHRP